MIGRERTASSAGKEAIRKTKRRRSTGGAVRKISERGGCDWGLCAKMRNFCPALGSRARATYEEMRVISSTAGLCVQYSLVFYFSLSHRNTHSAGPYNTTSQPAGPAHTSLGIRPPTSSLLLPGPPGFRHPYPTTFPAATQHNAGPAYILLSGVWQSCIAHPKSQSVLQERVTRAVFGRRLITRVLHKTTVTIRFWFVRLGSRVSSTANSSVLVFQLEPETADNKRPTSRLFYGLLLQCVFHRSIGT